MTKDEQLIMTWGVALFLALCVALFLALCSAAFAQAQGATQYLTSWTMGQQKGLTMMEGEKS